MISSLILQRRKLRAKEVKEFAPDLARFHIFTQAEIPLSILHFIAYVLKKAARSKCVVFLNNSVCIFYSTINQCVLV